MWDFSIGLQSLIIVLMWSQKSSPTTVMLALKVLNFVSTIELHF